MALRWKKVPKETGLSSIGRDPRKRSSHLHDGGNDYFASVNCHDYSVMGRRVKTGWYWVAVSGHGFPYVNTCDDTPMTEAEAKAAAMAYVKQHLTQKAAP